MTVNTQPSSLDPSQSSVVSSVDQERIEELPVRRRNYLDFVLLAPGVSSSPTASGASASTPLTGSGFTLGGLRSRSNNLSIDGLDNNDEYTGSSRTELSPEIVQEFQVVNNGLSTESGGASGGSINAITRSGTNTVHGDAFLFAQHGALNARAPFETESGKPSFRRFRRALVKCRPRAGAWISCSRVWHKVWQTPFLFARYGIQSTHCHGSSGHCRLGSEAWVRPSISFQTRQYRQVLGRRKGLSVRTLSLKFRRRKGITPRTS